MSSKIKVDTIENSWFWKRKSGVWTQSCSVAIPGGFNTTSGNATVGGTLGVTGTSAINWCSNN